jgi:excisionase family DNA binding protein
LNEKLLLRPAEAAEVIGVSRSRAYELIGSGQIPSIRIGGSVRVPVAALRAWIDERLAEQRGTPGRREAPNERAQAAP